MVINGYHYDFYRIDFEEIVELGLLEELKIAGFAWPIWKLGPRLIGGWPRIIFIRKGLGFGKVGLEAFGLFQKIPLGPKKRRITTT